MLHLRWSINISPCNKTYTHWHIHTHTHVLRIVAAVLSRKIKWTYFLWRFPSRTFSSLRRVSHYNSELLLFGRSVAEQSFWLPCNIYYRTNWRQAFAGLKRRIPYHAWIFHGSIYCRKSFVLTRYTHIWEMYSQSFARVPFSCFTCASVYSFSLTAIIRFILPCFHFNCRRRNQCASATNLLHSLFKNFSTEAENWTRKIFLRYDFPPSRRRLV